MFDTRKRKIPGWWRRGERYDARLRIELGNGRTALRRIALKATNLDEAIAQLESKRVGL